MSDTPRVDAQMESPNEKTVPIEFARRLERELIAEKKEVVELNSFIDEMMKDLRKALRPHSPSSHS